MNEQADWLSLDKNPLESDSPDVWERLVHAVGPASLLVIIRSRMSILMRQRVGEEDIFQEALLRAWRDRQQCQWRGIKAFRSWLLTLIDHCIADAASYAARLKRGGGEQPVPFSTLTAGSESRESAVPQALVASTTPSRLAVYKEQAAAVEEALASLPEDLQPVVRFRLIEQLPIEEVAVRLGIGPSAVRHRLYKGAELYRARLAAAFTSRFGIAGSDGGASGADDAST